AARSRRRRSLARRRRRLLGLDRLLAVLHRRRGRLDRAAPAQPAQHTAARLGARQARGHVAGGGFADPALVLRTQRTEVADLMAMAPGSEIGLRALALQDRAAADVAGHDVVYRPELLLHRPDDRAGSIRP